MYWERNNRLLMAASPEFPWHFLHVDRAALERGAVHDTRFNQVSRNSVSALCGVLAGRISMILQVDALGCVPDGRFLDRVSMSASSAVLTDAGGGLRTTDVGKHVAVPGAMDLVASITELVNEKDVEHASMTAGGRILTAPLGPGNGFRADLNAGQRITVTGAGPGGVTLLSAVVRSSTLPRSDWPIQPRRPCRMPWPSLIGLTWSDWTTTPAPAPQT